MNSTADTERTIGLLGATGIGISAIVGGGILALAGVAFATTGPSAILAFALNGVIAFITVLSFAELSTSFPESGGTYTFAKKVLSVEAAFGVGWVVWFASIVAAVLYASGFGYFLGVLLHGVWHAVTGDSLGWFMQRPMMVGLAILATAAYTLLMMRKSGGGGQWENIGKLVVFAVLIAGGMWALTGKSVHTVGDSLSPFFAAGGLGLLQAMGFTFIALQGFDLIAAVAGEVRDPGRNIPRAMLGSLGIVLAIYLPLLFIISTVGVAEGESIAAASRSDPEGIVAHAARNYLGSFGYWFVIVAAILSMLSALQANLFAASRVARAMARDRTLPKQLSISSVQHGTPILAVLATAGIVIAILLFIPDVAAAGAAASLIFLITFGLSHGICILARRRSGERLPPFRTPWFPIVPALGGAVCISLAVYQGVAVPSAGLIASAWLAVGTVLFVFLFAGRARMVDASTTARDPSLVRMRGKNPLVLVPIANPDNAAAMVAVADAIATPEVGRVLLLSIVVPPAGWKPGDDLEPLAQAQRVLGESLAASVGAGLYPEALTTVAAQPWDEIGRVARTHHCESLLLGLSDLSLAERIPLDHLVGAIDSDIVILRAPQGWRLSEVRRVLVPIGGQGGHDQLRARLLGSLQRTGERELALLRILPTNASQRECARARRQLSAIAEDVDAPADVQIVQSDAAVETLIERAEGCDLIVLGVQRLGRRKKAFGQFTQQIARGTNCPLLVISRRG